MSEFYLRKLYVLLQNSQRVGDGETICNKLDCITPHLPRLQDWWATAGQSVIAIADTSDRVNFGSAGNTDSETEISHPISGQRQQLDSGNPYTTEIEIPEAIRQCQDAKTVYHWFWRFLPELSTRNRKDLLLYPANEILPDCTWHSYQTTVSALVGAMYPDKWQKEDEAERPYLILFTFSPVQEFIKSSRKFLDFWAGSYLLHYLGAKLCWYIAEKYGADAVITPSLWEQEIIDAFLVESLKNAELDPQPINEFTNNFLDKKTPSDRFEDGTSTSLATAGFPNVITALVPGKAEAEALGKELSDFLKTEWQQIAEKVRHEIQTEFRNFISDKNEEELDELWNRIGQEFPSELYRGELLQLITPSNWTWRSLWQAQIDHTWEPYWTAVPLGDPDRRLSISNDNDFETWQDSQNNLAKSRIQPSIATPAEIELYDEFNVGTWWGSFQARLGQLIQAVKNTRSWQIAIASGERSSLSGQYTALHPRYNYNLFSSGGGLPNGSMRLFWRVMAEVFPGLFNGSEMLNAIELTKRMAWGYGGVAESLGIEIRNNSEIEYENLIRFPNLSSIAAARFATDYQNRIRQYWDRLNRAIGQNLSTQERDKFAARTRGRPFHIHNADQAINPNNDGGQNFNGVMFSSKWLADDMSLDRDQTNELRGLVEETHQQTGFKDGSPSDWWVIVLGDGDGMGKYVSGTKLHNYEKYIVDTKVADRVKTDAYNNLKTETKKRMGPATHVALNRALLDFSNRLVPHITERRFCGKVVYSQQQATPKRIQDENGGIGNKQRRK